MAELNLVIIESFKTQFIKGVKMNYELFCKMVGSSGLIQLVLMKFSKGDSGIRTLAYFNSLNLVEDSALAALIIMTEEWRDTGRIMTVGLRGNLRDSQALKELVGVGIESINLGLNYPINDLQISTDEKEQEKIRTEIMRAVVTKKMREEINKYGLSVCTEIEKVDKLYVFVKFIICNGNKASGILSIDALLGNIHNYCGRKIYHRASLTAVQANFRKAFGEYLERVTTVA